MIDQKIPMIFNDADVDAVNEFDNLPLSDKFRLLFFLLEHEEDIDRGREAFGILAKPFQKLFNRHPGVES